MWVAKMALVGLLLCGTVAACAQTEEKEAAILELGAEGDAGLRNTGSSGGPTVAVEMTPIENWLEIEAGVTRLYGNGAKEWDVDFLLKKPWTLSRKVEFMAGVGPEWVHTTAQGVTNNSIAGELAGDFMFWPAKRHRYGWYLEPAYEYSFSATHEQSLGISGGLLITIP